MAGFYAVYHGKEGLYDIAKKVNMLTCNLKESLTQAGFDSLNENFFDTLVIKTNENTQQIHQRALDHQINLRIIDSENIGVSLDETTTVKTCRFC